MDETKKDVQETQDHDDQSTGLTVDKNRCY